MPILRAGREVGREVFGDAGDEVEFFVIECGGWDGVGVLDGAHWVWMVSGLKFWTLARMGGGKQGIFSFRALPYGDTQTARGLVPFELPGEVFQRPAFR
jgi:hypothetical protein